MERAIHLREAVSLAGRFPLLAGVTLDVEVGEVVHLRGSNGAGKSSLLRALAGLLPIIAGEAIVLGHDLRADRRTVRGDVGLLGHTSFLYDDLTVEDNARFAVRAGRHDLAGIDVALRRLELTGRLRTTEVGRLSAGQRRRVALAILVAKAPRLWLLDEPHAGLDLEGRVIVDGLVAEAREAGTTIVMSSHEIERAGGLADRTVEISGGQISGGQISGVDPANASVGVGGVGHATRAAAGEPSVEAGRGVA